MNRTPQISDFVIPVEGIGAFTFAKRTMRDELEIQREYAGMLQGVEPTAWLDALASWLSVLRVLTVRAPDGWDLDELDPLDEDSFARMKKVFSALREQENSFRNRQKQGS